MFYVRLVFIFLWLALVCVFGLVRAILRWGDINLSHWFARAFSGLGLRIVGVRVEIEGREQLLALQPCIYVCNHQSMMDILNLSAVFPPRTLLIAKKQIVWAPFFGLYFAAAGNILIDRKNRAQAVSGLNEAVGQMRRKGASIWIFPEGTRNGKGEGLLPFKKGAFHMAVAAQIPIVPVVAAPIRNVLDWRERRITPGIYHVRVLEPWLPGAANRTGDAISPDDAEGIHALALKTHARMEKAFLGLATRSSVPADNSN